LFITSWCKNLKKRSSEFLRRFTVYRSIRRDVLSIFERFQEIISEIIINHSGTNFAGIDIERQFRGERGGLDTAAERLNAAFLIKYAGTTHHLYDEAIKLIEKLSDDPEWDEVISFLEGGMDVAGDELESCYSSYTDFAERFDNLHRRLTSGSKKENRKETVKKIRELFFPEGAFDPGEREKKISALRKKRKVTLTALNRERITQPEREILFTSNALLTLPSTSAESDESDIHPGIRDRLKKISTEEQLYWYDHPVQIGVNPEQNEFIYGLEHFDRALAFEEEQGIKEKERKVDFLLSVSVTHRGLHEISRDYMEYELKKKSGIRRLNLYIITEKETGELIENLLIPAAEKYLESDNREILHEIFGVDGMYGRHYTFLKAVTPLWRLFISPETRGTFKIDLDQVFPQKELLEKTGRSAFGHLKSELWGASGRDSKGDPVHLGLLAGALVNEKDIGRSLFHPDVPFPEKDEIRDTLVFYSKLPQALSTAAEMQTRYGEDREIDGRKSCIQRIHVTGGTTGILEGSLRKYRPFTPSFIGRAEDQAFLMSVLYNNEAGEYLRYLHRDGLIMRHDKETFASESIKAAKTGKMIGDYLRIVLFSYYAVSLPWGVDEIKDAVDPFTGCFISRIPWTVVIIRLLLETASLFKDEKSRKDAADFLRLGSERLGKLMKRLQSGKMDITRLYEKERRGWDLYYDIIDVLEEKLASGDEFALTLRERARGIIGKCRLDL
jgi:hypothetical protein